MKYFSDKIRKKKLFDKVFMFFKFLEDYGNLTIKGFTSRTSSISITYFYFFLTSQKYDK